MAGRTVSGAFASLVAIALMELRRDVRLLLESRWNEAVRRRAEELAASLADACGRQGLDDLHLYLRSTTNLVRLSRKDALPVLPALQDKLASLLVDIEKRLPKRGDRLLG